MKPSNLTPRLSWLLLVAAATVVGQPAHSPEAQRVLAFLDSLEGRHIVAGQHNYPGNAVTSSERIREITGGKVPGLWGSDFGFTADDKDGIVHRPAVVAEAKRQWRAGALVVLTWHAVRPLDDEPCGWKTSVQAKLTDAAWTELTTPGTPLHQRWCAQVDRIAEMLQELRDARVAILWRPYHEMNGDWFWWGGRPGATGFVALWRLMHERFTRRHGLDNLIWVWNPNAPFGKVGRYADFFPGHDVVDVLAADVYDHRKTGQPFLPEHYEELRSLAAGKPIALGEVGPVPTPAVLEQQRDWVWFMTWSNFETRQPEAVRTIYSDARVLSLEHLPAAGFPAPRR
jgi:mannan endo-1,4-beta-mannosidase